MNTTFHTQNSGTRRMGAMLLLLTLFVAPSAFSANPVYTYTATTGGTGPATDGAGTWSVLSANWLLNNAGTAVNWPNTTSTDASIGNGGAGGAITLGGGISCGNLTFNSVSSPYTLTAGTLTLNGNLTVNSPATISSGLTLGAGNLTWSVATGQTLTLNTGTFTRNAGATLLVDHSVNTGTISTTTIANYNGIIGPWAIVKGSGTPAYNYATVSSGNVMAYTPATTLSASSAWGGLATATANGINYDLSTAGTFTGANSSYYNCFTLRYTGSGFSQSGTAIMYINGIMNAGSGLLTINTPLQQSDKTTGSGGNEITLAAESANITIGGVIANNGSSVLKLTTTGPNTITLSGANTFTGNMTVNGGTVAAANGANANVRTAGPFGNATTAGRTVTINNGGTVSFTAANVLAGGGDTGVPALSFIVNPGGTLQTAAPNDGSGGGDYNAFGNITLNGGTFTTGDGYNASYQAAGMLGSFTVGGSAPSTINTTANNTTANGIMLGGPASGTNTITFNVAQTGGSNADLTVSAPLTDSVDAAGHGALMKTGAGAMVLSGVDTYTGPTIIGAGTLALSGAGSINNSSTITVSNAATFDVSGVAGYTLAANQLLQGVGVITGNVSSASGAIISPGLSGVGTLSFGNDLNLAGGGRITNDLSTVASSGNDQIVVGGNLTLGSADTICINALSGSLQAADYVLFNVLGTTTMSTTPALSWVGTVPTNYLNYSLLQVGNNVVLHYSTTAAPVVTASASPVFATTNESTTITATVTPGSGAIASVTVDLSQIGGPAGANLVLSSNNVYTNTFTVGASVTPGAKTLLVTVTDNTTPIPLTGSASIVFTVIEPGVRTTMDLSGTWSFTPGGGSPTTIQVPGGGWYKQGFTGITNADYATSITIPSIGQPQVTVLQFGAVNYEADLFINGTFVGTSIQSFTPATFDISSFVVPGNTYSIRVHVSGRNAFMLNGKSLVPNAAGWSPNTAQGIFRSAQLLIYPQIYISDVFVRPSVANSNLYYDVWLTNDSSSTTNVILSGSLSSWNSNAWNYPALPSQMIALAPGATTKVTIGPVSWNLGSGSYWWPNVPYQSGYTAQLHCLNLAIAPSGGGSVIYQTSARFGFRDVVQQSDGTNTCYFLNGTRVNFRGDNIQGADYDSIVYGGGPSDAYDTLPGFLPGTNGWAQAVDNWQHLNYNFARLHQEPVTPYMLDVCDEMGMMVMEETAIRGSANDQDFVNGYTNMVNHLEALYTRDRNHPAIVRLSQCNEPNFDSTDSTQFETNLYNAAMSVDGTRPVSIDCGNASFYNSMTYSNFSVYAHYGGGTLGQYVENVYARTDRPYGEGEYIWPADDTPQGFCWFATATQAMRAQNASDARPYTLLSAWAGFVPGVSTTGMTIEQGGNPLYGVNNLPNPWTNTQIQRVQAGFNPVLVVDTNYWESAKLSDINGDWPANIPFITPGQSITHTLMIYNDTFSGTAVDVFWEFRQGSTNGPIVESGVINATVPLGYTQTQNITFTTPNAPNGTSFYLVLSSQKNGVEMFRESSEQFTMLNQTPLTGTAFGASPPYAAGSEYYRATDGDLSTFYDYSQANGGYTGIDLGAANTQAVSVIVYTPRLGFESRMVGGQFLGSNDGTNYTVIYTINSQPSGQTVATVNSSTAYRYLEYVGPSGSYCNIAEMAFYATNTNVVLTTPTNLMWNVSTTNLSLSWPDGYTGWWLQSQTNGLNTGLGTNWVDVPGSSLTNNVFVPVDVTNGAVFYRLVY